MPDGRGRTGAARGRGGADGAPARRAHSRRRGGRPHVRGTGLSVELLAGFYRLGATPDELLLAYPQLSAAGLYDALSYYHDHRLELDAVLDEHGSLERLRSRYGFSVGERGRILRGAPVGRPDGGRSTAGALEAVRGGAACGGREDGLTPV